MFRVIKKVVVVDTVVVLFFVALALLSGGDGFRYLGEMTGISICSTLADEADVIQGKALSMVTGARDEAVDRASIGERTGRTLKEYKKEL